MKMTMKGSNFDVDTKKFKALLEVSLDLDRVADASRRGQFCREDVEDYIIKAVADSLTETYLTNFGNEIMEKVDLEAIVKRVQFNVVKSIGGN